MKKIVIERSPRTKGIFSRWYWCCWEGNEYPDTVGEPRKTKWGARRQAKKILRNSVDPEKAGNGETLQTSIRDIIPDDRELEKMVKKARKDVSKWK